MARRRLKHGFTRREFLGAATAAGAAATALGAAPVGALARGVLDSGPGPSASAGWSLTDAEGRTLDAALARIIPAERPGDWSAVDVGARDYIEKLLGDNDEIYAGGPTRAEFASFQPLSRIKEMGWAEERERLRRVYRDGLMLLNERARGDFAALPAAAQDAILLDLDMEGSPFFAALFAHTMEGVYSHPVYGGNKAYRAWNAVGYRGDVHGVRFPDKLPHPYPISDGSWNVFGGYAPEEMSRPGTGSANA